MAGLINPGSVSPTLSSKKYTPVDNFKRSIKHNPTFFPNLNIRRYGKIGITTPLKLPVPRMLRMLYMKPMFHQSLITWPYSGEKYMHSVFVKIILTNQGKKIVHKHQGDKDAQKVYAKLSAHALKSTKDLLNSSKLLTYTKPARVGDRYWQGIT